MAFFENRVQKDLFGETVVADTTEEFILPDYMPEIGRVLRLCSTLLPDEPYLGTDGAEFSGRIEYRLLYSDGEGRLTEAPLEGRYRYRAGAEGGECAFTEEVLEGVSLRPTAPRKLSVRARVVARPHVMKTEALGVSPEALMPEQVCEVIRREQSVVRTLPVFVPSLRSEGQFTLEEEDARDLALVSASASVLPERAEAHDGYVSVYGKLVCLCVLKKEGQTPFTRSYSLPFEEELTASNACAGDLVTVRGACPSPTVTLEEAGGGMLLSIDTEYSLSCLLHRNESTSLLCDLYAHGASYSLSRKSVVGESLLGAYTGNFTVSGELPLPADFASEGRVLIPSFTVKESTPLVDGGRAVVEGVLGVSLLALGADACDRTELSMPIRLELPLGCSLCDGDRILCALSPVGGTVSASGGNVRLSTELSVSATAKRPFSASIPVAAVKGEYTPLPEGTLLAYYPTEEDSLFSIGKRYGVPLALLAKQNGIPDAGDAEWENPKLLDGYSYLLIG